MIVEVSGLPVYTTNATPGVFALGPIADNEVIEYEIHVLALSDTGVAKSWDVRRTGKKIGANAPLFVGSQTAVAVPADAGAASWTIGTSLTGVRVLNVTLTGAAATNIKWEVTGVGRTCRLP